MNTGLARERGVGLIALFKMFTQEDEMEATLSEIEGVDEELKIPSKYMKNLINNYGVEPEILKPERKTHRIKGTKLNAELKVQESIEQTKNLDEEEKMR